ncbi:efflux RND transporter periplasmic adaptor subunit [Endothiovibrio diazotrophicus]
MRLNRSQWLALGFAVALAAWLGSGQFVPKEANGKTEIPVAKAPPKARPLPTVRVRTLQAETVERQLVLHGHTAPARLVTLKAETEGRVVEVAAERGGDLAAGDRVVRIDPRTRRDDLSRAEAQVHQRELEYRAAKKLHKENLRAKTQLAETLTQLEQAQAELRAIQLDIRHLEISAPFAGRLEERVVEVGDYVAVGDPVATVVELAPLIVTAQATEQEVGLLHRGQLGHARLVTGQRVDGTIRYVAATADPETRTFTVELELPNGDGGLAAGVTAVISIDVESLPAHYVSAALLSLDDDGETGVKTVDEDGTVQFHPAEVVRADSGGVWLAGLPQTVRMIVVGQGFVLDGQKVKAAEESEGTTPKPSDDGPAAAPTHSFSNAGNPREIS